MSEQPTQDDFLPPASAEQDLIVLIKRMQQQLTFLEKKIDLLVSQSSSEKPFSQPFRSFGHSPRRFDRENTNPSAEKSYYPRRDFGKRHSEDSRGFAPKKKSYDGPREMNASPEHRFEKRRHDQSRGFDPKKKPFSFRRKDHR